MPRLGSLRVRSLFPHFGYRPSWYVLRDTVRTVG
jgi:hypothetical protein